MDQKTIQAAILGFEVRRPRKIRSSSGFGRQAVARASDGCTSSDLKMQVGRSMEVRLD